MSDELIQLLAAAVITLTQVYILEPWKFTAFARFWDWLARTCGRLANHLAWLSMRARANYYDSISIGD